MGESEIMNETMRNERKFLLSLEEFYRLDGYFSGFLMQDPHNAQNGYRVRSLYFDTLDERDFYEKEDGLEVRRKIRLRIYDPDDGWALLEMKQKQGSSQRKRSVRIGREDAKALADGNYGVLLKYSESFASECFGIMNLYSYRPKTIVEYQRKAYMAKENKIRLTFDHHITASESCFDIFCRKLSLNPVWDPGLTVFEVKYNGFLLSYIKDAVNQCGREELSVGKYCLGRSASLHYLF